MCIILIEFDIPMKQVRLIKVGRHLSDVEVTVEIRRQHKKELNDFHSPHIIRVIKSRRMR